MTRPGSASLIGSNEAAQAPLPPGLTLGKCRKNVDAMTAWQAIARHHVSFPARTMPQDWHSQATFAGIAPVGAVYQTSTGAVAQPLNPWASR